MATTIRTNGDGVHHWHHHRHHHWRQWITICSIAVAIGAIVQYVITLQTFSFMLSSQRRIFDFEVNRFGLNLNRHYSPFAIAYQFTSLVYQ